MNRFFDRVRGPLLCAIAFGSLLATSLAVAARDDGGPGLSVAGGQEPRFEHLTPADHFEYACIADLVQAARCPMAERGIATE